MRKVVWAVLLLRGRVGSHVWLGRSGESTAAGSAAARAALPPHAACSTCPAGRPSPQRGGQTLVLKKIISQEMTAATTAHMVKWKGADSWMVTHSELSSREATAQSSTLSQREHEVEDEFEGQALQRRARRRRARRR